MSEIINSFKLKIIRNKRKVIFLLGLALIGFISGSIFITFLSKSDRNLTINYINNFITSIRSDNLNYTFTLKSAILENIFYTFLIWILGISIIGIPINIIIFYFKSFMIGFSISSFFLIYNLKSIPIILIYLLPQLLYLFILTVLMLYSLNFSLRLLDALLNRKSLDFKVLFNNYLGILLLTLIFIIIVSLFETFVVPFILKKLLIIFKF